MDMYSLLKALALFAYANAGSEVRAPLSKLDPRSIFQPVQRSGPAMPGERFRSRNHTSLKRAPLPTNAWWENSVLYSSQGWSDNMSNRSGNIFQMPYTLLLEPHGVCVMQPYQTEKPAQQFYDENFGLTLGTDVAWIC